MKFLLSTTAALTAVFFSIAPAAAQTATDTFDVSLTVEAQCTIAAQNLNFGTTGLIATNIDAQANLTVECTEGSPFSIGLNDGGSGSTAARVLTNGSNTVNYQLYRDAAHTAVWGNTQGTDVLDVAAATGAPETHTIYGRVPAGQNAPVGAYADTITATIWYGSGLTGGL